MKIRTLFALVAVLLVSFTISSCEPKQELKTSKLEFKTSFKMDYDLDIDIQQFKPQVPTSTAFGADKEQVLCEMVLQWDINNYLKDSNLKNFNFKELTCKGIVIDAKEPKDFDLSFFETIRIYIGKDNTLLAEVLPTQKASNVEVRIVEPNLLQYAKVKEMPVKVTSTRQKTIGKEEEALKDLEKVVFSVGFKLYSAIEGPLKF